MNLFLSFFVYVLMAVLIGAGILMAVQGSFWMLLAAVVVYFVLLTKFGCHSH